MDDTYADALSW